MHLKSGIGLTAFLVTLALTGCATSSQNEKRVQALQLKLKKQRAKLQDLKERNLVLERRVKAAKPAQEISDSAGEAVVEVQPQSEPPSELPASFTASATGAAPVIGKNLPNRLPSKLAMTPSPAIAVDSEKTGEHFLYSKILDTYRAKNAEELDRTQQLLLKSYPESVFADNSIYLTGLLAFEKQDYKTALKSFDKLLREYPRSNKAVAALFAKASVEKRMGHATEAKKSFIQVRDLFPGSPEAARVSVELKLLESASVKRRES